MRKAKTVNIIVDMPADNLEDQFVDDTGALVCLDMEKAATDLRKHLPKPTAARAGMALMEGVTDMGRAAAPHSMFFLIN